MENLPGQKYIKKRLSGIMKACRTTSLTRVCNCVPFKESFDHFSPKKHERARSENFQREEDDDLLRLRLDLEAALNDSKSVTNKLKTLRKRIEKKSEKAVCSEEQQFRKMERAGNGFFGDVGDVKESHFEDELLKNEFFFNESDFRHQVDHGRRKSMSSFGLEPSPIPPRIRIHDFNINGSRSGRSSSTTPTKDDVTDVLQDNSKQEKASFPKMPTQPTFVSDKASDDGGLISYTASMYSENDPTTEYLVSKDRVDEKIRSVESCGTDSSSSTLESSKDRYAQERSSSIRRGSGTRDLETSIYDNQSNKATSEDEPTENRSPPSSESSKNPQNSPPRKIKDAENMTQQQDWKFLEIPFPYFSNVLEKEEIDCLDEHLKHLTDDDFVPLCFVDYIYDASDRERVRYHFRPEVIPRRYQQRILDSQPGVAAYFQNKKMI